MLGLKMNEITKNEADSVDLQKTHLIVKIRATNSKTGLSRVTLLLSRKELIGSSQLIKH